MSRTEKVRPILGCDIGNGYGYISLLLNPEGDPISLLPADYGFGDIGMPTAAYITPPSGTPIEVLCGGKTAERRYARKPEQMVRAVKTRLKEVKINIPEVTDPVEASRIYAAVVRDLVILAQEELKNKKIEPIYDIVFTFPAAFADDAYLLETMQKSIESVEIDGHPIRVWGRLPEPAAVAIDYLHYMQHTAPEEVRVKEDHFTVLVYDLGHGTFDTAVVTAQTVKRNPADKREKPPYILHSKEGLPEVGGKNFDEVLYNELCQLLKEQYDYVPQNPRQREEIRAEAVKAKLALTDDTVYTASIVREDIYCMVDITRERFEELSQHLLFQTLELVQKVLEDAQASGIKIDGVVLSGGGSRMPMVRKNLEEMLEGQYPVAIYRPGQAVSYGASRFAYGLAPQEKFLPDEPKRKPKPIPNPVMEQRTDCCYGIEVPTQEGEVRFLIPSGKARPAVSEKISFDSEASRLTVKLYRSKEKNKVLQKASREDCESILWFPFNVTPGAKCEVSITALEDYSIRMELHSDQGDHFSKTTADAVSKLV